MKIGVTVTVPKPIYDIYAKAAATIDNYTVAKVMSDALEAYVHTILEDMQKTGALSGAISEELIQ